MAIEDLSEKWTKLKAKKSLLVSKRDQIKGRLDAEKAQLNKLVEEVKAQGYDPKELGTILKEKEAKLAKDLSDYEAHLADIENKLKAFETI